jgi:hypothetical protein
MFGKPMMFLDAVRVDADYLGARLPVTRPIVAHTAQLFGADRGFISRIEEQDHWLSAHAAQLPSLTIPIGQIYLWGKLADLRPGSCLHRFTSSALVDSGIVATCDIPALAFSFPFCNSTAEFASFRRTKLASLATGPARPQIKRDQAGIIGQLSVNLTNPFRSS